MMSLSQGQGLCNCPEWPGAHVCRKWTQILPLPDATGPIAGQKRTDKSTDKQKLPAAQNLPRMTGDCLLASHGVQAYTAFFQKSPREKIHGSQGTAYFHFSRFRGQQHTAHQYRRFSGLAAVGA